MTQELTLPPLTDAERQRFEECQNMARTGEKTFLAFVNAITIVRDERLYRDTHPNFEDWLKEVCPRICKTRRYADYLIEGGKTVKAIAAAGLPEPQSEKSIRPLASVDMEQRGEVWEVANQIASEAGRSIPTENDTREAVARFKQPEEESKSLSNTEGYKGKSNPAIKRSFAYVESIMVNEKAEKVYLNITRPAVSSTGLKKMTLKNIELTFQKLENAGYKIVRLSDVEGDAFD